LFNGCDDLADFRILDYRFGLHDYCDDCDDVHVHDAHDDVHYYVIDYQTLDFGGDLAISIFTI
jgi:hypothetical protein